jgi:sortase A
MKLPVHRIRLGCSLLLLTTAVAYAGQATYMSAKAQLAQVLLLTAWERSQHSGEPNRPWPWADTHPVALLEIPRLGIRQVVLDGHSGEALAFGPGLVVVEDSFVLGGHRDSHLSFLRNLAPGDELQFTSVADAPLRFRIAHLEIVDTTLTPDYTPPRNSLTLITCYPFDAVVAGGPLRLIAVAFPSVQTATGPQSSS